MSDSTNPFVTTPPATEPDVAEVATDVTTEPAVTEEDPKHPVFTHGTIDKDQDADKYKKELLKDIQKCLRQHDGLESNIGVKNPYWDWVNEYRVL